MTRRLDMTNPNTEVKTYVKKRIPVEAFQSDAIPWSSLYDWANSLVRLGRGA